MSISVTPGASRTINPSQTVTVRASHGRLTHVTVTNSRRGTTASGSFSHDKTTWSTTEVLAFDTTYDIVASGVGTDGEPVTTRTTVSTLDPARTSWTHTIPAHGTKAGIGVGQPIVVRFNDVVANKANVQKRLQITSDPPQPGAWHWIDYGNHSEVHYRPKDFWQPGTTITLDAELYGLDLGDGVYDRQDRHETYHVRDSWVAKADGSTHRMVIYHNGDPVRTMDISMGKPSTPTHRGIHVISSKRRQVEMNSCSFGVCPPNPKAYDVVEYWAERISNDGEFVHENPASVGAQGNTNVSHGCINLDAADAQWFYHHFGPGDVVIVSNSGGPALPVWDRYGDWSLSWKQWKAGNAST